MSVNVELLHKTLAQIEARPELWNQEWWRKETDCGTAHCFAGWTAVLHGAAFLRQEDGTLSQEHVIPPGGGDPMWISDYAAEVLGIEHTISSFAAVPPLFEEANTLDDLRRIVDELTDGAR